MDLLPKRIAGASGFAIGGIRRGRPAAASTTRSAATTAAPNHPYRPPSRNPGRQVEGGGRYDGEVALEVLRRVLHRVHERDRRDLFTPGWCATDDLRPHVRVLLSRWISAVVRDVPRAGRHPHHLGQWAGAAP